MSVNSARSSCRNIIRKKKDQKPISNTCDITAIQYDNKSSEYLSKEDKKTIKACFTIFAENLA